MNDRDSRDKRATTNRSLDEVPAGGSPVEPSTIDATIDDLIAQLAVSDAERRAPSSVRQRLQAEIDARGVASLPRRGKADGSRWASTRTSTGTWTWSAAAVAILAALIVSPTKFISFGVGDFARSIAGLPAARAPQIRIDSHKTESAAEVATMDDSAFDTFDLPYSDKSIANGTGATIRVSLPDSELLAWGVPSHGRDPDDLVPVDLMLGDDGLPQAVHLLPATNTTSEEIYP